MTTAQLSLFKSELENDREPDDAELKAPPSLRKRASRRGRQRDPSPEQGEAGDLFATVIESDNSAEPEEVVVEVVQTIADVGDSEGFELPPKILFDPSLWLLRPDEGDFINVRTGEIRDEDEFAVATVESDASFVAIDEWDESQALPIGVGSED